MGGTLSRMTADEMEPTVALLIALVAGTSYYMVYHLGVRGRVAAAKSKEGAAGAHSALRDVPLMGVIWCVSEACKLGFYNGNPEWSNLGQGQPEIDDMPGAPDRPDGVDMTASDCAYGPIGGTQALREAIAAHYNRLYRQGMASQYTAANVSVASGGRLVLSRLFAALRKGARVGYKVPDYTAYEDYFWYAMGRGIVPVCIDCEAPYHLEAKQLRDVMHGGTSMNPGGLDCVVVSNPANPTGYAATGEELEQYCTDAAKDDCLLVLDEFYSHFVDHPAAAAALKNWMDRPDSGKGSRAALKLPEALPGVSAAAVIDDIEASPIVLIDGLTKCFRLPGMRIGWIVGPEAIVAAVTRTASAVDGGPPQAMQKLAIEMLEESRADQELAALQANFTHKRDTMVAALEEMGMVVEPNSGSYTFYLWVDISALPPPLNYGRSFFAEALKRKVMVRQRMHAAADLALFHNNGSPMLTPLFSALLSLSLSPSLPRLCQANFLMCARTVAAQAARRALAARGTRSCCASRSDPTSTT